MPKRNWENAFFAALEETGSVAEAAKAAKVDRSNMYHYKKTDEKFAQRWDEALDRGADALEAEARRRAMDATTTGSHVLLMFLLKGLRPQKWRESRSTMPPAELDKMIKKELDRIAKGNDQANDLRDEAPAGVVM